MIIEEHSSNIKAIDGYAKYGDIILQEDIDKNEGECNIAKVDANNIVEVETNEYDIQELNIEGRVEEPTLHMEFNSIDELFEYYRKYAMQIGFGIYKRNSKKIDGVVRYFTVACNKHGMPNTHSDKILKPRPAIRTGCQAKLRAKLLENGRWGVTKLVLEHNHLVSPTKARYERCNRVVNNRIKRQLRFNNHAEIPLVKSYNSIKAEFRRKQMTFTKKDCENYVGEIRRLALGEGDAPALQIYFSEMQATDSNFFYVIDLNEENRIRNVFWADGRSRATYKEFSDVITFDTTYLTNKYDMPFAPFVGVNHHGQSTLFGCGLMSSEDSTTFTWLFKSWLFCMDNKAPNSIITDQDKAMQNAIEIVFPKARHRWCLWHIMKKIPEKLRAIKQYECIKFYLRDVIYDSHSVEEFESKWDKMKEKYELGSNEWLKGLYIERYRWVPCLVKDRFWAGMSTTQRSESMNSFFDGFVNAKTSLKEFVEQYGNALKSKVEKETEADYHSLRSHIPLVTQHAIENQFKEVYTNSKFKEFQKEVVDLIYCDCNFLKSCGALSYYDVDELLYVDENQKTPKNVKFQVIFIEEGTQGDFDIKCDCKLFEFRGIICRHIIKVLLFKRHIFTVPTKYILPRWRKDIKRLHTKIKVPYSNWKDTEEGRRYDWMCEVFHEVADIAYDNHDKCNQLVHVLLGLQSKWNGNGGVCSSIYPSQKENENVLNNNTMNMNNSMLSPTKKRCKGRPPVKRKQSMCEKISRRKKKTKKIAETDSMQSDPTTEKQMI